MVGGVTGQRLARQHAEQAWGSPNIYYNLNPAAMITAFSNGVVFIWSMEAGTWDTLFWFSAEPGDRWHRAHDVPIDGNPSDWIEVIDTTTIIVDGIPLRQLAVEQVCDGTWVNWSGPITERFGYATPFYFPPACATESGIWELRCYSDNEIDFSYGSPCDVFLSATTSVDPGLALYPNPGGNQFTVQLMPGVHAITLIDAAGREVLHLRTSEQSPVIGTTELAPGLYLVRVGDQAPLRWVKE